MMNQDTWHQFQEVLATCNELREKFAKLANQVSRSAPSVKLDRALFDASKELREHDGLLLQLWHPMSRELNKEVAELGSLLNELFNKPRGE